MPATKTEIEFAQEILAAHLGLVVFTLRGVERVEDDGDVFHITGEIEDVHGNLGAFSIPEHWPEGTMVEWL